MDTNLKEFLELVQLNPDLPVIPLVDSDVVLGDYYSSWIGSICSSEIREYVMYECSYSDGFSMFFRNDKERIIEDILNKNPEMSGQEAEEKADNMDWQEAIILSIGLS